MNQYRARRVLVLAFMAGALSACAPAATAPVSSAPTVEKLPRISAYVASDADRERLGKELRASALAAGLENPPNVPVVAWQNPETAVDAVVRCLEDAGVPVARLQGGYEFGSDSGRNMQHVLANYVCNAQYPVRKDIDRPVTEAEIALLHQHLVESFIPCAEGKLGQRLSRPTRQEYGRALLGEASDPVLRQFTEVLKLKDAEIQSTLTACPLRPAGFRDYER